jgi:hypothetical protein
MSLFNIRFHNYLPLVAVLVGATILVAPTQAHADFQLTSNQSTSTFVLNDASNGATNGLLGDSIRANLGNGFAVSGSAMGSSSGAFAAGTAGMDLSSVSISSTGSGTLVLYLTENDLSVPVGQGILSETITGQFLGQGSGTVSMVAYGNDTNDLYGNVTSQSGTSPAIGPGTTNVATNSVGLGGSASTTFTSTNPYSITEIITITFIGASTVALSSDGDTTFALPAPAGLVLALAGSPVLAFGAWLHRRKATLAA